MSSTAKSTLTITDTDLAARFTSALDELLTKARAGASAIDPLQGEVIATIRAEMLRGGKRLRPTLAYLAHLGTGGADNDALTQACISLELIHHFLLIHDDVFDRDLIRHGGPNVVGAYYDQFRTRLDPTGAMHYASAFAIMAGNVTNVLAHQALLNASFPDDLKLAAAQRIEHMLFEIMAGELLDVAVAMPKAPAAPAEQLLKIARYKTATYSFETPLAVGAILAGAPDRQIGSLTEFGRLLGIAYQLVDDLLGLYGDEATLGKPVGGDMREGKQTMLILEARATADPPQQAAINHIWGNPNAGPDELTTIRQLVADTGARQRVTDLARQHQQEALAHLHAADLAGPYSSRLEEISFACIKRTS
jgi:geranylgeranyl diphosphate synthase type II